MNGYPPGFLEQAMPHLRTPQTRARARAELIQGARQLNPAAMDQACSRGAIMEVEAIGQMVEAARRGQFHPLRMVECIRCAIRWNADLLRPGRDGTSAVVSLLRSIQDNKMALNQAVRLVERRWHGSMVRVDGQSTMLHDMLKTLVQDAPAKPEDGATALPTCIPKP